MFHSLVLTELFTLFSYYFASQKLAVYKASAHPIRS